MPPEQRVLSYAYSVLRDRVRGSRPGRDTCVPKEGSWTGRVGFSLFGITDSMKGLGDPHFPALSLCGAFFWTAKGGYSTSENVCGCENRCLSLSVLHIQNKA